MSYFTRDGPKLNDRFRGKTSDELIDEIKKEFDNDKMWFDKKKPTFSTFSRSGFPFEDDMFPTPGNTRPHFDDMSKRHPEFSNHLRHPSWRGEPSGSSTTDWEHAYTIPVKIERGDKSQVSDEDTNQTSGGKIPQPIPNNPNLSHHGLRNTVDIGEQMHKNSKEENETQKRACSAPPNNDNVPMQHPLEKQNNQPKRFTSKVEITPVNPYDTNHLNNNNNNLSKEQQTQPMDGNTSSQQQRQQQQRQQQPTQQQQRQQQPTQQQQQPSQTGNKFSNVRHIPIFVEGRRDPVFPKPSNDSMREQQHPQSEVPPQEPTALKRKLDATTQPSNEKDSHPSNPATVSCAPKRLTPLQQIEVIQQDVDELMKRVEKFDGKDRQDKEYLYLDEMLTRDLIKLDLIEVEGHEDIRMARKNTIRSIQKCISILESKVPSIEKQEDENLNDVEMSEEQPVTNETMVLVDEGIETNSQDVTMKQSDNGNNLQNTAALDQNTESKMDTNEQATADNTLSKSGSGTECKNDVKMDTDELNKTTESSNQGKPESKNDELDKKNNSLNREKQKSKKELQSQGNSPKKSNSNKKVNK